MNITELLRHPRLLIEADLQPLAGTRFQPTGFPDLGAATYTAADGTPMLLVESAQSMANRLEAVCWDEAAGRPVLALNGLPYVESTLPDGVKTNSLLEAHRLNSPYIVNSAEFATIRDAIGYHADAPFDRQKLAQALFKFDPNSLLHGIFIEKVGGVVRLPRALTAFIEAARVRVAASGGVKVDRVQPSSEEKDTEPGDKVPAKYGKAEEGYGNVPYQRDEYTGQVTAYFNLDLSLIAGFQLPPAARELLVVLALFKIQCFLETGLRLRTACDLELKPEGLRVKRPANDFTWPSAGTVEARLKQLLAHEECTRLFASPRLTAVTYAKGTARKAKAGKEAAS
ncbi:MAG TPA: type I-U CRISPR-associated RAMP protein Csb1/Cas7u [Verrucomicrobiota bacterium]|nr:type I-U CRISPR-associated RAMP protein Csb1/Cas7u [Verrucomicrobiota bacterium]HNU51364.1 type I-U CRISPR-associated RAMP protein Csb1/Cas7u [Verrucomicrobiota bacterium]